MSHSSESKTTLRASLREFFFAEEVPYGMALVRILVPLTLMHNIVVRWPHIREFYSTDGAPAPLADNYGYANFLPELSGTPAVALYTIMLCCMISGAIGWCTRFSLIAASLLYSYFTFLDCMGTVTKYTVIACHFLFLAGLSNCGDLWSVDRWLKDRSRNALPLAGRIRELRAAIWPQRLAQILLGTIYFGAAVTKLHTPAFFSGDQLMYWMMTYISNPHPMGDYLAQHPMLLVVFGYITIIWEVLFLFCVWRPWARAWVLGIGAMFHIMTYFTLGLITFPVLMIATYAVFLTEEDVTRFSRWWRKRRDGRPVALLASVKSRLAWLPTPGAVFPKWAGAVSFMLTVSLAAVVGVEAEYRLDPYKLRSPDGPLTLKPLDSAEVQRLIGRTAPIRERDKFLALDLGQLIIGEHLVDRRKQFQQGEMVIAQVTLTSPHEDTLVECNLYDSRTDPTGNTERLVPYKIIDRAARVVGRELLRTHFSYTLSNAFEPGEYFFVVRSGGEEVIRKRFTLTGPAGTVAAN